MYGAMLGDIIGAPYEFDRGQKTKNFGPLFIKKARQFDSSRYTDDSLLSVAICDALLDVKDKKNMSDNDIKKEFTKSIFKWTKAPEYKHIYNEFGGNFSKFLESDNPQPYNSRGNGSAMRVGAVGFLFDTLEETQRYARLSAEITHNHPEGVRAAVAVASVIFLARTGSTKEQIKEYVVQHFSAKDPNDPKFLNKNYNLARTLDEIRPGYKHVELAEQSVPEAITCFLESNSYEDAIRNAISIGGDTDTIACITGSMAEAFYGVPANLVEKCKEYITPGMQAVTDRFYKATMKLETVKEEDFAQGKISPIKYAERARKYGDISHEKIIKGLDDQLGAENLPDKGRAYAEFMKKMMQAGYPVDDVDTLWQVNNILNDIPAEQSPEEEAARNNAKAVLEEVITSKRNGEPVKLTPDIRIENLNRVIGAVETFNKVSGGENAGLKKSNISIVTNIGIKEKLNAPLNPGDRIRMADSMREMLEILETTDPPLMLSSVEFIAMKDALKKFAARTEKVDPETADEVSKRKYEADKTKLKQKVVQYIKKKREQSGKGHKRSEAEYLRVSAAEALFDRLKKDDFNPHPEKPRDAKLRDMLVGAKRAIVQKDKTNKLKASAALMSYKLLQDSGQEVTYSRMLTNYNKLCKDNLFRKAVDKFDTAQMQDVIENGTLGAVYNEVILEQQHIEEEKIREQQREQKRRAEAEKRKLEAAKKSAAGGKAAVQNGQNKEAAGNKLPSGGAANNTGKGDKTAVKPVKNNIKK